PHAHSPQERAPPEWRPQDGRPQGERAHAIDATLAGAAQITAAVVGACDQRERRARLAERRVQPEQPGAHRRLAQTLRRTQPPAESPPVPFGAVESDGLY